MENNEILLVQIEAMENFYIHSMKINHAFLSEKFSEINKDMSYSDQEIKEFFVKHPDLYESGWLDWYWEAISVLKNYIDQNQIT